MGLGLGMGLGLSLGGAAAPFTPLARKVAGALWARGDSLTQSAGVVTGWVDKYALQATATAGNSPTYTAAAAAFNNRAVIHYHGAGSFLRFTGFAISQPNTIYVVADFSVVGFLFDGHTSSQIASGGNGTNWSMTAGTALASSISANGPHVFCCVFNGATSALYIDNSQVAAASGPAGANALSDVFIGLGAGGQDATAVGDIAEWTALPGADASGQRAQYYNYAATYYALAVS